MNARYYLNSLLLIQIYELVNGLEEVDIGLLPPTVADAKPLNSFKVFLDNHMTVGDTHPRYQISRDSQ